MSTTRKIGTWNVNLQADLVTAVANNDLYKPTLEVENSVIISEILQLESRVKPFGPWPRQAAKVHCTYVQPVVPANLQTHKVQPG
jgi:hypothetical protein